jgi:hypothetical protein
MPHPRVSLGVVHAAPVEAQAAEPLYSIREACVQSDKSEGTMQETSFVKLITQLVCGEVIGRQRLNY